MRCGTGKSLIIDIYKTYKLTSFLILFVLFMFSVKIQAQDCSVVADYTTTCVGTTQTFVAGVNSGNAMQTNPGNNYGCLRSTPNSKWFFFKVETTGYLNIKQTNSNNRDVDGAIWGPFDSIEDITNQCGSFPAPIDCDYAGSPYFSFSIPAQAGKYYVLLVANYSNRPTEISLEDNGSTATTDCSPDIQITKSVDVTEVESGKEVTWSIDATNAGVSETTGVKITDILPEGLTYISHNSSDGVYNQNTGIWNIGNMPLYKKFTLKIKTKVNKGTEGKIITNSVSKVISDDTESNSLPDKLSASVKVFPKEDQDDDGLPNRIDLDDDNDGILDDDEMDCTTTDVPAGNLQMVSETGLVTLWSGYAGNYYSFDSYSDELILDIGQIAPKGTIINLQFHRLVGGRPLVSSSKNNIDYVSDTQIDYSYSTQWITKQYVLNQSARYIRIKKSGGGLLSVAKNYTHNAFTLKNCNDVDTDGDGIPNHLDLDSDNDGCPDAIEGAKNIKQLKPDSSINSNVDNNGVPILVNGGQSVGNSQKATEIQILTQPQNQKVCIGSNAIFLAKAVTNNNSEQVNYQWQKYNTANSKWEDIIGKSGTANSNVEITLDLGTQTNKTNNGNKYRVKFTSVSMQCPKYSDEATLTIKESALTFTKPNNIAFCVNNIINVNFANTTNGDVNTPPDYYEFSEATKTMLDITDVNSECCPTGNTISWKITPQSNGQTLSGIGQPSASLVGKKLWLNIASSNPKSSYTEKQYTIIYKVTDCNGNESNEKSTIITIKPRPKIERIEN